ncbi:putative L-cysteine desulfhydrase 1 [Diplonema papillatum]|nr:putative L-cysteine desulfhydrase 1 [Diplonema papillatum]
MAGYGPSGGRGLSKTYNIDNVLAAQAAGVKDGLRGHPPNRAPILVASNRGGTVHASNNGGRGLTLVEKPQPPPLHGLAPPHHQAPPDRLIPLARAISAPARPYQYYNAAGVPSFRPVEHSPPPATAFSFSPAAKHNPHNGARPGPPSAAGTTPPGQSIPLSQPLLSFEPSLAPRSMQDFRHDEFPSPPEQAPAEIAVRRLQWLIAAVMLVALLLSTLREEWNAKEGNLRIFWFVVAVFFLLAEMVRIFKKVQQYAGAGSQKAFRSGKGLQREIELRRMKHARHAMERDVFASLLLPRQSDLYSPFLAARPAAAAHRVPNQPSNVVEGGRIEFGTEMREKHFLLRPHYLNSASYGATPIHVQNVKDEWDRIIRSNPSRFRKRDLLAKLESVTARLARVVGSNAEDTVLLTNCNQATSSVLKGLPWEIGDRVLIYSVEYDATKSAMKFLERTHGVETVTITLPLPFTDDDVFSETERKLTELAASPGGLPRLACFCHVTSKTAWTFPARELVALFHKFKVPVMVDGAQAAGHLDLNINEIGAEWYLGTVHKWMYSCQGAAFLVTRKDAQPCTLPLSVTGYEGGGALGDYREQFYKSYETLDFPTWLSIDASFDFVEQACGGWDAVRAYCRKQAQDAVRFLGQEWGSQPLQGTPEKYGNMPIMPLPASDIPPVLAFAHNLAYLTACGVTAFLLILTINKTPQLCLRLSCQIYTSMSDWQHLSSLIRKPSGNTVVPKFFTKGYGKQDNKKKKKTEGEDELDNRLFT